MIEITKKTMCCGCTACASICPQNCIEMVEDEEGFLYPKVDKERCTSCGLCNRVCPVENPAQPKPGERSSVVMRADNRDVVMDSTSGGLLTPLAEWMFENKGVLCAATFDDDFHVKHMLYDSMTKKQYERVRGSKYVQSDLRGLFSQIRSLLNEGRFVCFIGTTCQVSGLRTYLMKDYDNLLLVDLVCHGVPSPKLWEKYLQYQTKAYGSPLKKVNFRNKTYGYHSGTMKLEFENGKEYYGSARVDFMLKSFFKEISSRPICYTCPFKTLERCSDLTIYDCWHVNELVPSIKDDDRGYTNIIIQTQKGKEVLAALKGRIICESCDTEQAVALDGIMVRNCAKPHPKRAQFYQNFDETPLEQQIQRFIPISRKDHIIEGTKGFFHKTGLIGCMRTIKKKLKK